jgi:hypothetical protein
MKAVPVEVPDAFGPGGRGPELQQWLVDSDLLFGDSEAGFAPLTRSIAGAQVDGGWVVFHGLQVIQIVPEEVHSYWHLESEADPPSLSNVWCITDSTWLGSFAPRHLSNHEHYLLTFYDELAEVICRDLLFGLGVFDLERAIASFPQLAYAYLRRAMSREKKGKLDESAADYKKYIAISPDLSSVEYARRCLSSLGKR